MAYGFVKDKTQFGPTEQIGGNPITFVGTVLYPRIQVAGSAASGEVPVALENFSAYGYSGLAYIDNPTSAINTLFQDSGVTIVRGYTPATVTGTLQLTAAANSSGGNTVYTGTIINGGSNAYAGMYFTTAGFTNAGNNVSFVQCVASTTTTLTLVNAGGVAETHAATATVADNFIMDSLNVALEVEPTAVDMGSTYPGGANITMNILAPVEVSNGGETDCLVVTMYPNMGQSPNATITNIAITSNVLTVTCTNTFYPGQSVAFTNVGTATFLNNVIVQVVTATGSSFTAEYTHADYASAADTGNVLPAQTHFWTRNVYTEQLHGDGTSTPQYWNIFRATNFAANSIGFFGSGAQGHISESYKFSAEGPRENNVGTLGTHAGLRMAVQHGWRTGVPSQRINQAYGIYQEDNDINVLGSIYLGTALTGQWLLQGSASPDGVFSAALGSTYFRTNGLIYAKTRATSINLSLTSVVTTVLNSGIAVYNGTITGGGSNAFVGVFFTITGFTNSQNNGTFRCTASSTTQLTLTNWNAISETTAATANYTDTFGWTPINPGIRTATTTDSATNDDGTILCNGTFTETLPTTGIYPRKKFTIKNIGTGVITVSSSVNIDGATSLTLSSQYASVVVEWDGTQYWVE